MPTVNDKRAALRSFAEQTLEVAFSRDDEMVDSLYESLLPTFWDPEVDEHPSLLQHVEY